MRLRQFLSLCQICHFDVTVESFLKHAKREWFASEDESLDHIDYHEFDAYFIECLRYDFDGLEDFYIKLVGVAKTVDRSYAAALHEAKRLLDVENAKRATLRKSESARLGRKVSEPKPLSDVEIKIFFEDAVRKFLADKWREPLCSEQNIVDMRKILRKKIMAFDNFWRVRRYFDLLPRDARVQIEIGAVGETRYAYILYGMDVCLGKYHAFLRGQPVAAILSDDPLDERKPHSICRFCGDVMPDWGRTARQHCRKPKCKTAYNKERQQQLRAKKQMRARWVAMQAVAK